MSVVRSSCLVVDNRVLNLALDPHNCRVTYAAPTGAEAERGALETFWVKRGWRHICPECQRRQAIEAQKP